MQITSAGPATSFQEMFSNVPLASEDSNEFFCTTNEKGAEDVLSKAAQLPVTAGKVLFFTSCMYGLNLASVRGGDDLNNGVDYLLSVDKSKILESFWGGLNKIVVNSGRQEAILQIHNYLLANADALFPKRCSCNCPNNADEKAKKEIAYVDQEINEGVSWLSTDDRYERIKKVFVANRFAFVRADLYDSNAMEAISVALNKHQFTFDGLYLSNVREYAEHDNLLTSFQTAQERLKASCNSETFVVDTVPRVWRVPHRTEKLGQQLRLGFFETSVAEFFPLSPAIPVPPLHVHASYWAGHVIVRLDPNVLLCQEDIQDLLNQISSNIFSVEF